MTKLRQAIREAIIALRHEDPQENFEILSEEDGRCIIKVLWLKGKEEVIELKVGY